ncbi:MAG: helix-turn-helix domain-containing protein [Halobacteriovoraceae bacterium]|nr:helix-turn-helix domain-containing protein [Halobacteriovoraceae bacterium]
MSRKKTTKALNLPFLLDKISEMDLKHYWLAEKIGVTERTFTRWVRGHSKRVHMSSIEKMASVLNCTVEELVTEEDDFFATTHDKIRAKKIIDQQGLIDSLECNGQHKLAESILHTLINENMPLTELASLYYSLARVLSGSGDYKKSNFLLNKAEEIAKEIKCNSILYQSYALYPYNYGLLDDLKEAELYFKKSCMSDNDNIKIQAHYNMSVIYNELEKDRKLERTLSSLKSLIKKAKIKDSSQLDLLFGELMMRKKRYQEAKKSLKKSLKSAIEKKYWNIIGITQCQLAHIYTIEGDNQKSNDYLNEASNNFLKNTDDNSLWLVRFTMGKILIDKKQYQEARRKFQEALKCTSGKREIRKTETILNWLKSRNYD